MELERLRRDFRYDAWANAEVYAALRTVDAPAACVRWLAHVIGAETLWMARLSGGASLVPVWPSWTLGEIERPLHEIARSWPALLEREAADLGREIAYTNSKGERWTSRVEDVLSHVLFHGAYHRGQIASALRAAGFEPPATDHIHAARRGLL
jgi:uncharacterized damage-inducible protein DinB